MEGREGEGGWKGGREGGASRQAHARSASLALSRKRERKEESEGEGGRGEARTHTQRPPFVRAYPRGGERERVCARWLSERVCARWLSERNRGLRPLLARALASAQTRLRVPARWREGEACLVSLCGPARPCVSCERARIPARARTIWWLGGWSSGRST